VLNDVLMLAGASLSLKKMPKIRGISKLVDERRWLCRAIVTVPNSIRKAQEQLRGTRSISSIYRYIAA